MAQLAWGRSRQWRFGRDIPAMSLSTIPALLCQAPSDSRASLCCYKGKLCCLVWKEMRHLETVCAPLEELRLTTWPRSVMRSGKLNGCMEIGDFASWVTGFRGSTGGLLENKHWEHLNHKRYLAFFMGALNDSIPT